LFLAHFRQQIVGERQAFDGAHFRAHAVVCVRRSRAGGLFLRILLFLFSFSGGFLCRIEAQIRLDQPRIDDAAAEIVKDRVFGNAGTSAHRFDAAVANHDGP
jgi:hypothetical protein